MNVVWWIPIILGCVGGLLLILVWIYTGWRMKLHKQGILDIRHDGLTAKPGEPKTIFDVWKLYKEHKKTQFLI